MDSDRPYLRNPRINAELFVLVNLISQTVLRL